MTPASSPKPQLRALAVRALLPVLQQKSSLDHAMEARAPLLVVGDQGVFKDICFGVCRHYYWLEQLLKSLLSKPLKSKDSDIKLLLMVGLYQLQFTRIAEHAAINETVNGAKSLKKVWAKSLVNAVLRNYVRQKPNLVAEVPAEKYAHPQWLQTQLHDDWPETWLSISQNNNTQGPMTLRVNGQKTTREAYLTQLKAANIEAQACRHSAHGIVLKQPTKVENLPYFQQGACSVQDEAPQLSAALLQLKAGQRVLDACAAPGGKTCHILETEPNLSELVAVDSDSKRLHRVRENLQRLQLEATLKTAEAQDLDAWWDGQPFHRILLDAPCSATGVIRRHPDIKLLRRNEDIAALCDLQFKLLQSLWTTLASGGILIYATCSLLKNENEKLLGKFVEGQADAIHCEIEASWGLARPYGRQLFPTVGGHDGFYYARVRKE